MLTTFGDTEESFVSAKWRKTEDMTISLDLQLYGVYILEMYTDIL